jgi:hypothetical protein
MALAHNFATAPGVYRWLTLPNVAVARSIANPIDKNASRQALHIAFKQ